VVGRHRVLVAVAVALLAGGCGAPSAPVLAPIADQTAIVGVELEVMLRSDSRSGLDFAVDSDLDLDGRRLKPTITAYAGGTAVFRWTPLATDIGAHRLTFSAGVDGARSWQEVAVSVRGDASPPTFRQPAGAGTTLDLSAAACVELDLVVDDPAAAAVTLAPGDDWPDGAELTQDGGLTGHVRFCPSPAQADAATVWPLSFVATDAAGGRAEKRYTVVLDSHLPPAIDLCARVAPWIGHTPPFTPLDASAVRIETVVTAAQGIGAVNSYWSDQPPTEGSTFLVVAMEKMRGGAAVGVWAATAPASLTTAIAPGSRATLYYFLSADDEGLPGCSAQTVHAPEEGYYSVIVEAAP
jgi:hypothetical protein